MSLTIDAFDDNDDYSGGARFYTNSTGGKKEYLTNQELWLMEDLLPGKGERYANGIWREEGQQ